MLAVFGASLTQQKTGFAIKLKSKMNQPVQIFGYGGMHLIDAGICFVDKILEKQPSHCFVDWFSTAYKDTDKRTIDCIDTIIYKFTKSQCKLVFLFFPRKDDINREEFYSFCKRYLKKRKVAYIDLRSELGDENLNILLRDTVHTTEYDSTIYSDIIASRFNNIVEDIIFPKITGSTEYSNINKISIERVFNKTIELTGKCEVIGFYLTVGSHSGILEVKNFGNKQMYNSWDRWCNFSRKHFFLPLSIGGKIEINILQDEFNTSTCKEKYNFKKERKKIILHEIYYVGDSLKITNVNSGKRISKLNIFFDKNLERLKRYKNLLYTKVVSS